MAEYKIIISGPMGAGKTTALAAVSDSPPVRTDVRNSDRGEADKDTTTVAMDYGDVQLGDGDVLRLYGTPGQERFGFMRGILARGALGIVLLIDASRADPVADLLQFFEGFGLAAQDRPFVVGVTKTDRCADAAALISTLQDRLLQRGAIVPCFACDVRDAAQVRLLLGALLAVIESGLQPA
jgi:signal recognition particle receptor subunit beta